ncbi:MAG: HU family DNA-binding protein [Candidatus Hydrogenedentota bacterium]
MTKRELVIQVANRLGMTQNEVSDVVQTMFDTVTETLVQGDRLEIRNFGVFEVKSRDARIGRNPRTGEEVPIPAKRVASFRPGKVLKDWVQNGSEARPESLFKSDETSAGKQNGSTNALVVAQEVNETPMESSSQLSDSGSDQQSLF